MKKKMKKKMLQVPVASRYFKTDQSFMKPEHIMIARPLMLPGKAKFVSCSIIGLGLSF